MIFAAGTGANLATAATKKGSWEYTSSALSRLSDGVVNQYHNNGVALEGLEHIAGMKNLTFLILEDARVSGQGLSHLRKIPNLKRLFLNGAGTSLMVKTCSRRLTVSQSSEPSPSIGNGAGQIGGCGWPCAMETGSC